MPHITPTPSGGDLPTGPPTGLPTALPTAPPARDLTGPEVEQELEALRHEITGLRAALLSRATIDQARGVLVGRYRISPEQAFNVLVRWSQHRNIKLRVIAEALVGMHDVSPQAPAVDPDLRQWLDGQLSRPDGTDRVDPTAPG